MVRRALEAALDEDRRAAASREPGEPDPVDEAVGVAPSFGQRQADALGMVAECALAGGLDSMAARPGDRYQVVVHVDAATLAEDADVPAGTAGSAAAETEHARGCQYVPAGTSQATYAATGQPDGGADRRTRAGKRDLAGNGRQMRRSSHECPGPSRRRHARERAPGPAAASAVDSPRAGSTGRSGRHSRLSRNGTAAGLRRRHRRDAAWSGPGRCSTSAARPARSRPALRRALWLRARSGSAAFLDARPTAAMRTTYGTGRMAGRRHSSNLVLLCRRP